MKVYAIRRSHRNGLVTVERAMPGAEPVRIDPRPGFLFQYGHIGTAPRHLAEQLLTDCFGDRYTAMSNASAFAMAFFGPPSRAKDKLEITQREVLRWLSNRIAVGAAC